MQVRRQALFAKDMLGMRAKLSAPGAIPMAVAAYRKFLQLASKREGLELVPSPEVDLVWHCHMQLPDRYRFESVILAGRLLDHNDELEDEALDVAAVATSDAWHASTVGGGRHLELLG